MTKKIKIAHVVLNLDVGGLETLVVDMIRHIDRARFETIVVCIREKGALAEEVERLGCPVYSLGGRDRLEWGAFFTLAGILRKEHVHIVHCHNTAGYFYGGAAAVLAGFKRIIYTEHGRVFPDTPRHMLAERILSWLTYKIVAVSEDMKKCLIQYEKISPKKIQVIHNGVDTEKFHKINNPVWRVEQRKILGIGEHDLVIGNVARFDPVKDHRTLLRAFALLVTRHAALKFVLVGDGPERENIERTIKQLDLVSCVLCLGSRQDVPELMNMMDVFVLSSKNEGISLTLLEAMACGLPVVATRVGGNPEIVKDGENGLLANPEDPKDLADKISKALESFVSRPPERRDLVLREGHASRITLKSMLNRYEALYAGA